MSNIVGVLALVLLLVVCTLFLLEVIDQDWKRKNAINKLKRRTLYQVIMEDKLKQLEDKWTAVLAEDSDNADCIKGKIACLKKQIATVKCLIHINKQSIEKKRVDNLGRKLMLEMKKCEGASKCGM